MKRFYRTPNESTVFLLSELQQAIPILTAQIKEEKKKSTESARLNSIKTSTRKSVRAENLFKKRKLDVIKDEEETPKIKPFTQFQPVKGNPEMEALLQHPTMDIIVSNNEKKTSNNKTDENSCSTCSSKPSEGCVNGMCFACCYTVRKSNPLCLTHYFAIKRREEDDNYVLEGLGYSVAKRVPSHFETKITNNNQAVVIWCQRDFFMNPNYCREVLSQQRRTWRRNRQANLKSRGITQNN